MKSTSTRNWIVRLFLPVLLAATSWIWLATGTKAMPFWLGNLGSRAGADHQTSARVLLGIMLGMAATLLLLGGKRFVQTRLAKIASVSYAFACVASIASIMALPVSPAQNTSGLAPLLMPLVGLLASGGLYLALERTSGTAASDQARLGSGWSIVAGVAIWIVAIGSAARLPIENNSLLVAPSSNTDAVTLDYVQWQGRTLPDTGLSRLLPMLTALTIEGKSIVVLYNPECSHCRELFETRFSAPIPDTKVIAVEIPPTPGTVALSGDGLGEMPCADCTRLKLPEGKHYILKPPTLLVVQDGRVICATDSDFSACLDAPKAPSPSTAPAATP